MVRVDKLIWEAKNIAHIARHDVKPEEVEEVCQNNYVSLGAKYGRIMVIGKTSSSRILSIILDPEPEEAVYYVVTTRTASKKEHDYYDSQKGGTE